MRDVEVAKGGKLRLGSWAFAALIVLTGFELWFAWTIRGPVPYLALVALLKALLIMEYFMHLSRMWRAEE